jgi:hypothetical protein
MKAVASEIQTTDKAGSRLSGSLWSDFLQEGFARQ